MRRKTKPAASREPTTPTPAQPTDLSSEPRGPGVKRYTPAEVTDQLAFVEQCMLHRIGLRRMKQLCFEKFKIGPHRVPKLVQRVYEQWKLEDEQRKPQRKAEAQRRIFGFVEKLHKELENDKLSRRDRIQLTRALIPAEQLLADVEGTRDAIKVEVDVRVREAVAHVITAMPPEMMQECLEEYETNRRLAEAYKAEHNLLPENSTSANAAE